MSSHFVFLGLAFFFPQVPFERSAAVQIKAVVVIRASRLGSNWLAALFVYPRVFLQPI